MRTAILAVTLGGVLLTGAACESGKPAEKAGPAPTVSAAPTEAAPDYSADTKLVCGKLQTIFNTDLETFGTQVGKMIAYKESKQPPEAAKAQQAAALQLKAVGAKVKAETEAAQDPELQTAGATSAAKFVHSSSDVKFFARINTTKDLDRTIEAQMNDWLTPVAGYCA